jgi:hypothetical protein
VVPVALADAKSTGLGLTVEIKAGQLHLWSSSGKEGTAAKPKLAVAADHTAELQTALAAIADHDHLTGDGRTITIAADGTVTMQVLGPVLAAVHVTADGKELFPNIRLRKI